MSDKNTFVSDTELAARFGIHRTTLWRWVKTQRFPQPIKLTPGCTRWRLSDVQAWEEEVAGGAQ